MARGERIAFTAPASAITRLAQLVLALTQESGKIVDVLAVALRAFLIGLQALEDQRLPGGPAPGVTKLIKRALAPEAPNPCPVLAEGEQRPETPLERGWRTWCTCYLQHYGVPYQRSPACGNAMKAIAAVTLEACAEMDHEETADLEALFVHRWRAYLRDPGSSKGAGDPGFLRVKRHALRYFADSIPELGSPWDKETKAIMRPALAAPTTPRQLAARKPTAQADLFASGARDVAKAARGSAS
jgi:hypothetical protein